ncbi:regulator of chromosome condensation 1/beta-lactamase-inhibitor protein II [Lipomyces tetrasporus]|uniref:Regulator of chromosome condensation 1/beta-lactamase-inhibitor protein II n=1 Tax=Lipomyces tetrasporus TaxID=54092 RepID=A0AAD7VT23_9ASCO|nr:regulator of chromosome condensation 1/beta-lactamase-inhibitor protein II [Lipomyces tetrasporus]KAJ8100284.1 regulator of chromosome condensation 1/beta-lactamase-inhibitor protein II [Lipomyces tetrasporus]
MTNAKSGTFALLSFGSNAQCQLSHSSAEDVDVPTRVEERLPLPTREDDVAISSNGNHTLLLISGEVYATGDNTYGQCFVPASTPRISTFRKIDISFASAALRPSFVAGGWDFSVVIASSSTHDEIYIVGHGPRGELGIGAETTTATTPQLIQNFPPRGCRVRQVCAGMGHTLVLLDDGNVYGWGHSRKGQLGPTNTSRSACWTPTRLVFPDGFDPDKVVCGREFSAGIDTTGRIIVLHTGKDIHGLLDVPSRETITGWTDFQCGWTSLHVLLSSGRIVSWGNNSHCQHVPRTAPPISQISCGSEHTLALASDGKIYAWGWGEHGNCGRRSIPEDVNVRHATPVFDVSDPKADEIVYLGAGCATSWIGILHRE